MANEPRTGEERISEWGFMMIVVMTGRTNARLPRGWRTIVGELRHEMRQRPIGLMLTVESTSLPELHALASEMRAMPWGSSITNVIFRGFERALYTFHIPASVEFQLMGRELDQQMAALQAPLHYFRAVPTTPEQLAEMEAHDKAVAAAIRAPLDDATRRYAEARAALVAADNEAYAQELAAGDTTLPWHEWVRDRPSLPPFEQYQAALLEGREPELQRLLAPSAADAAAPASDDAPPLDETERIKAALKAKADAAKAEHDAATARYQHAEIDSAVIDCLTDNLTWGTAEQITEDVNRYRETAWSAEQVEAAITRLQAAEQLVLGPEGWMRPGTVVEP